MLKDVLYEKVMTVMAYGKQKYSYQFMNADVPRVAQIVFLFELIAQSYKHVPLHEKKPTTPNRRTSVKHLNQPCKTLQCRVMNSSNVGNTWMRCIFSQNQTHNLHHEDDGEIFDFIH